MVTILFLCIFTHDATGRKTSNIVLKNPSSAALKFYGINADIANLSNQHRYVNETHWPFATAQPTIPVFKSKRENQTVLTDIVVASSGKPAPKNISYAMVWIYGLISTTAINICATLGAICKPFMKKRYFPWILMWMMGVGIGSMLSASVVTLLPEALLVSINSVIIQRVVVVMSSVYVFYLTDSFLKLIQYKREADDDDIFTGNDGNTGFSILRTTSLPTPTQGVLAGDQFSANIAIMEHANTEIKVDFISKTVKSIKDVPAIVWMVIIGDGLHNFVDGLTIGAAFVHDAKAGLGVVLAILFEEIPCELGDFAVLLKAGLSVKMVVILNFAGASTNYIGLIISILIGDLQEMHAWIYGIAAGMFLYISLGVMFAEMLDLESKLMLVNQNSIKSKGDERKMLFKTILVQNIGLLLGFFIQLAIIVITTGKDK